MVKFKNYEGRYASIMDGYYDPPEETRAFECNECLLSDNCVIFEIREEFGKKQETCDKFELRF